MLCDRERSQATRATPRDKESGQHATEIQAATGQVPVLHRTCPRKGVIHGWRPVTSSHREEWWQWEAARGGGRVSHGTTCYQARTDWRSTKLHSWQTASARRWGTPVRMVGLTSTLLDQTIDYTGRNMANSLSTTTSRQTYCRPTLPSKRNTPQDPWRSPGMRVHHSVWWQVERCEVCAKQLKQRSKPLILVELPDRLHVAENSHRSVHNARGHLQQFSSWLSKKSAHARTFGGAFELILCMHWFSSWFLDNQPENCCTCWCFSKFPDRSHQGEINHIICNHRSECLQSTEFRKYWKVRTLPPKVEEHLNPTWPYLKDFQKREEPSRQAEARLWSQTWSTSTYTTAGQHRCLGYIGTTKLGTQSWTSRNTSWDPKIVYYMQLGGGEKSPRPEHSSRARSEVLGNTHWKSNNESQFCWNGSR